MWTVPAQIFWAPTRAKLIAAARFIPGVCGVLVSRLLPGITRTPFSFQSVIPVSFTGKRDHSTGPGQAGGRHRRGKHVPVGGTAARPHAPPKHRPEPRPGRGSDPL